MDIVKRAYFKVKEEAGHSPELDKFHTAVIDEMKRLIRVRAYGGTDWPSREFGPLPEELSAKARRRGAIQQPTKPLSFF